MSIALESNTNRVTERSGLVHGSSGTDNRFPADPIKTAVRGPEAELDSCSSSSIGKDSDVSGGGGGGDGDSGEVEVQSSFNRPLDSLAALEEVLPIKRGISNFYNGKAKSFTTLADAYSGEIAKPEDAYTRKRKNLLAHSMYFDNRCINSLRNYGGGMSKRPANSRSTMALAGMRGSFESNSNSESSNSNLSSPTNNCLPPLYPHGRGSPYGEESAAAAASRRSYSLFDLQCAEGGSSTAKVTDFEVGNGDGAEEDKM